MSDKKQDLQKINFGDYAIADSITYYLKKMPGTWWKFKPVTSGMELDRSKFMIHNRVITTSDGIQYDQPPTSLEIAYRELALTFDGSSLQRENGEQAIPIGSSIERIEALLRAFPQELIIELWVELGRHFPKWGASSPEPPQENTDTTPEEEAVLAVEEDDPNS